MGIESSSKSSDRTMSSRIKTSHLAVASHLMALSSRLQLVVLTAASLLLIPPQACGAHQSDVLTSSTTTTALSNPLPPAAVEATAAAAAAQSDMTGCDLWFASASAPASGAKTPHNDSHQLAHWCECRDEQTSEENHDNDDDENRPRPVTVAIGRLDCRGENFDHLREGFELLLERATPNGPVPFKIDYLTIQTQAHRSRSARERARTRQRKLQVNQLAIMINTVDGSPKQQLDWILSLIKSDELQSLSISVESNPEPDGSGISLPSNSFVVEQLELAKFLQQLRALTRLEVSLDESLQLAPLNWRSFSSQASQLTSLSLTSIERALKFQHQDADDDQSHGRQVGDSSQTALTRLVALEHLSLDSNQLEHFHLFEHFPRGHLNVTRLSLAKNRLKSIGRDLCSGRSRRSIVHFSSLAQLDLSSNRLRSISFEEAQLILLTMPKLINLYLQHNQIVHLHLGALLRPAPTSDWPNNLPQPTAAAAATAATSQLEFIDLSHNQLVSLLALQLNQSQLQDTRLRSINLAHNRLQRPISLISWRLAQVLTPNTSTSELFELERHFELSEGQLISSVCDYLSRDPAKDQHPANGNIGQVGGESSNELVELQLAHNQLDRVERRHFHSRACSSLELLKLNNNQIRVIERDAFKRLQNLQQLDLSGNKLVELPEELFSGLHQLHLLNLASNSIAGRLNLARVFGSGRQQLKQLQELSLAHNQIEHLELMLPNETNSNSNESFKLQVLHLAGNRLELVSSSWLLAPLGGHELSLLRLDGNKLTEFNWIQAFQVGASPPPDGATQPAVEPPPTRSSAKHQTRPKSHSALVPIARIEHQRDGAATEKRSRGQKRPPPTSKSLANRRQARGANKTPPAERSIQLDDDDDDDDVDLQLEQSPTGSALILSRNQLTWFGANGTSSQCDFGSSDSTGGVQFVKSLQTLFLDHNQIRELTKQTFGSCFTALEVLDLQANQLRIVNELAFSHLKQLRQLNLANNNLIRVSSTQFQLTPQLIRLDLSRNQLIGFDELVNLSHSLDTLNLSQNPALRLNSGELLQAMLRTNAQDIEQEKSLRRLDLSGIASIWSSRQEKESSAGNETATSRLNLELLDLSDIAQLDWNFSKRLLASISSHRMKRLKLSPRTVSDQNEVSLVLDQLSNFELDELILTNGQLTNEMLLEALKRSVADEDSNVNSMRVLDLSRNRLHQWPFIGLGDAQKSLGLNGCFAAVRANLIELNLSQNRLDHELLINSNPSNQTDDNCYKLASLERLNVSSNSLESLLASDSKGQDSASGRLSELMPRLRQVDLSRNKLSWLPRGFFEGLARLELLKLSHNQLTLHQTYLSLSAGPLGLALDLSFNSRLLADDGEQWHSMADSKLDDLQIGLDSHLDELDQNRPILHRDGASSAISCTSLGQMLDRATTGQDLVQLVARDSQLKSLALDSLQNDEDNDQQVAGASCKRLLNRIHSINLEGALKWSNRVKVAAEQRAHNEPKLASFKPLTSWSLAENQLSSLDEAAGLISTFARHWNRKKSVSASHLDLSRNNLTSLDSDLLCRTESTSNLESLEVRNQMDLFEFDANSLLDCRQLIHLDLSGNRINLIRTRANRSGSWSWPSSLMVLNLARNQLNHLFWFGDLLRAFPALKLLDLRQNPISQHDSGFEWLQHTMRLTRPLLTSVITIEPVVQQRLKWQPPARMQLKLAPDESGLQIQDFAAENLALGPAKSSTKSKLSIVLSRIEDQVQVPLSESKMVDLHLIRFCALKRQLVHKVCLQQEANFWFGNSSKQAIEGERCLSFKPPLRGPSCVTKLANEQRSEQSNESSEAAGQLSTAPTSSDLHYITPPPPPPPSPVGGVSNQSDPLLNLIELIRTNWIRLKQFDLGARLSQLSRIEQDSVLFHIGNEQKNPLPVYTLTLVKLGLAAAAVCVVLLAIAMFVLLSSEGQVARRRRRRTSKVTDSSGGSTSREEDSTCSSQSNSMRQQQKKPQSNQIDSPPGSSTYDSSETMTTSTTSTGAATRSSGPAPSAPVPPPPPRASLDSTRSDSSGANLLEPASGRRRQRPIEHNFHDQLPNATYQAPIQQQRQPAATFHQQQYCSTPSSSLAPSSIETGETMQAVDSLQGSIAGSTLYYQALISPESEQQQQQQQQQLTLPLVSLANVHSVDQYQQQQQQHSIYGQQQPPVATVMRMVKSSTFNNAFDHPANMTNNAATYSRPTRGTFGHNNHQQPLSQTLLRSGAGRRNDLGDDANDQYHLHVPQSISLLSMAAAVGPSERGAQVRAEVNELDPATLSLLSLNSQLSSNRVGQQQTPSASGLCHYHTKQGNNQRQVGVASVNCSSLNGILFEQDDDEDDDGQQQQTSRAGEGPNRGIWFEGIDYPPAPPEDS